MHKKEAAFQTKFNHWVRTVYKKTGAFELKQCETILPLSAVQKHQIHALLAAKHGTLAYKIPDDTRSYKPFDCFALSGVPSFVVILFRSSNHFYLIDIDNFCHYRDYQTVRSLKETEVQKIAEVSATL